MSPQRPRTYLSTYGGPKATRKVLISKNFENSFFFNFASQFFYPLLPAKTTNLSLKKILVELLLMSLEHIVTFQLAGTSLWKIVKL